MKKMTDHTDHRPKFNRFSFFPSEDADQEKKPIPVRGIDGTLVDEKSDLGAGVKRHWEQIKDYSVQKKMLDGSIQKYRP